MTYSKDFQDYILREHPHVQDWIIDHMYQSWQAAQAAQREADAVLVIRKAGSFSIWSYTAENIATAIRDAGKAGEVNDAKS